MVGSTCVECSGWPDRGHIGISGQKMTEAIVGYTSGLPDVLPQHLLEVYRCGSVGDVTLRFPCRFLSRRLLSPAISREEP